MLLCLVKIPSVGVNMEMPHWLSAINCNAVCHLKRDLKNWQLKTQTGSPPAELSTVDGKLWHPLFSVSSELWKHKVQRDSSAMLILFHRTLHCHFLCTWKNNKCGNFILENVCSCISSACDMETDLVSPLWDGPRWTMKMGWLPYIP